MCKHTTSNSTAQLITKSLGSRLARFGRNGLELIAPNDLRVSSSPALEVKSASIRHGISNCNKTIQNCDTQYTLRSPYILWCFIQSVMLGLEELLFVPFVLTFLRLKY